MTMHTFKVGDRVTLRRDVERFPDFIAQAGMTGTVCTVEDGVEGDSLLAVRIDQPIAGAEGWKNEVHWHGDYLADIEKDLALIS